MRCSPELNTSQEGERWRQATGESEVPELQPTEKPGQLRDRDTDWLGEVMEGLFSTHAQLQLGKHPLLDAHHARGGGWERANKPPVQSSMSRREEEGGVQRREHNFVHQTRGKRTKRTIWCLSKV